MLGHPGISAYEFAGAMEQYNHEERAWEKATEQTRSPRADAVSSAALKRDDEAEKAVGRASEHQQPQTPVDEYAITQRRRGTFMNHTPRSHEMHEVRWSTKVEQRTEEEDEFGRVYTAYRGSSDDNTRTDASYSVQHSSYGSFTASQSGNVNWNGPVELDSRKAPLNPLVSIQNIRQRYLERIMLTIEQEHASSTHRTHRSTETATP